MLNQEDFGTLAGRNVVGSDGEKIGKIDQLYADREDGHPTFMTVSTGLFGSRTSFVPVGEARINGDDVSVPYTKDLVKDAPNVDPDGEISPEEEDRIYAHYQMTGGDYAGTGTTSGYTDTTTTGTTGYTDADTTDTTTTGYTDADTTTTGTTGYTDTTTTGTTGYNETDSRTTGRGVVGDDTSGPETDEAMTRSEERLRVGTQSVETGRARLRKYIVTENVTQTVPVSREEVRVEREPITEANRDAALSGGDLTEEEHEVTLHAEQAVAQKETVPVERIRLDKETVTDQQQVSEELRKEQVDVTEGEGVSGGTSDRERTL